MLAGSRSEYSSGDEQDSQAPPSSWHSKSASAIVEKNVNVAVRFVVVAGGPVWIVVFGPFGSPSTVQVWLAGVGSTLSDQSTARTSSVCGPGSSSMYWAGEKHSSNASPSSEHSNVTSSSLDSNVKLAKLSGVEAGGAERIVVSGGVVSSSTVQVYAGRRLVDVARAVGRAHPEGVLADGEVGVLGRRLAGGERGAVERACEGRGALVRREAEDRLGAAASSPAACCGSSSRAA